MSRNDPTDIQAQDTDRKVRETRAALAIQQDKEDVKWLMQTKRGRRMLWRQMELAGVFRSSFNTNAMQMAFNEGHRNYGNHVLATIHSVAPDLYPTMVSENT